MGGEPEWPGCGKSILSGSGSGLATKLISVRVRSGLVDVKSISSGSCRGCGAENTFRFNRCGPFGLQGVTGQNQCLRIDDVCVAAHSNLRSVLIPSASVCVAGRHERIALRIGIRCGHDTKQRTDHTTMSSASRRFASHEFRNMQRTNSNVSRETCEFGRATCLLGSVVEGHGFH